MTTTNLKSFQEFVLNRKEHLLKAFFWVVAMLLGAIQAWTYRFSLSSDDAISYLDIGDAYLRGDWDVAINSYWSPFYSWLLGITMAIFNPSPYWEFFVVNLVNLFILLFTLVCFEFLLRQLIRFYQKKVSHQTASGRWLEVPEWSWIVLGYTLFLGASIYWLSVQLDSPDLVTSAFVYLATGLLLRIQTQSQHWVNFILLGVALGFGYLSKSVMFPMAFIFLAVVFFAVGDRRRAVPRILAAFLIFATIATPYIGAISIQKGHLTFSEAGRLNYVWLVNKSVKRYRHWQGEGPGTPEHPTRQIFDNPPVYEFGTPIGGTFPSWQDPTYWYEGLELNFNPKQLIEVIGGNALFYFNLFLGVLIFCYLIFVFIGRGLRASVKKIPENWSVLLPAVAGLGIYMTVIDLTQSFWPTRYIAPFIVLFFAGIFVSVRLLNSRESKRLITSLTLVVLVAVGSNLFDHTSKNVAAMTKERENTQYQIAEGLRELGINPGDKVAYLGTIINNVSWARLARVQVVAEVRYAPTFWNKPPLVRNQIIETIKKKSKAGAIVYRYKGELPDAVPANDWHKIGNTNCQVYFLSK